MKRNRTQLKGKQKGTKPSPKTKEKPKPKNQPVVQDSSSDEDLMPEVVDNGDENIDEGSEEEIEEIEGSDEGDEDENIEDIDVNDPAVQELLDRWERAEDEEDMDDSIGQSNTEPETETSKDSTPTKTTPKKKGKGKQWSTTPTPKKENKPKLNYDPPPEEESEEEDPINTIGKTIPLEWYKWYDHIGYDLEGKKIMKSKRKDQLDEFLDREDNPNYWRTFYDEYNDRDIVISQNDINIIRNMKEGKFPDPTYDPYAEEHYYEYDDPEFKVHPLINRPKPKRNFIPSKWEAIRVAKLVQLIRKGKLTPKRKSARAPKIYDMWEEKPEDEQEKLSLAEQRRRLQTLAAPRMALPTHSESYNPPAEYLFDENETTDWNDAEPAERRQNYIPQKHDSLRQVGLYERLINERFERCLDLYLLPRIAPRQKRVETPRDILPKLPRKEELRPYPSTLSLTYEGHVGIIRCISLDPTGHFMASGSDDCTVRVWEISSGRCLDRWNVGSVVHSLSWCPNPKIHLLIVAVEDDRILFINACTGSLDQQHYTETVLRGMGEKTDRGGRATTTKRIREAIKWERINFKRGEKLSNKEQRIIEESRKAEEEDEKLRLLARKEREERKEKGENVEDEEDEERKQDEEKQKKQFKPVDKRITWVITCSKTPKYICWHHKGDYFASVHPKGGKASVLLHQLSRRRTQNPFRSIKGEIQTVSFHPTKPFFLIATQKFVRIYDLLKQEFLKKLEPSVRWISSIDVHPQGDNVIVGSYDRKFCWFDLDMGPRPYKMIRAHTRAVRKVVYHKSYPLFASCGDDGGVFLFHGRVFSDLTQDPLIVPVNELRGHNLVDGLGVLDCVFHPTQPWVFSAGADSKIHLWT